MPQPPDRYPSRRAARPRRRRDPRWDGELVRRLREHLALTQKEFADELNARQQTVSEWETGRYRPRGPSARLLTLIAESADFEYEAAPPDVRSRPSAPGRAANRGDAAEGGGKPDGAKRGPRAS